MTVRRVLLLTHLLLVLAGLIYYVLATTVGDGPDANIGVGLAAFWLIGLGLPWSWPLIGSTSYELTLLPALAPALLNLALHWLVPVVVARVRGGHRG